MNARWERTNRLVEDGVLIAVCLERIGDHPLFAPPYGRCKQAFIRGQSTDSTASFRFQTCPLAPTQMERFQRLEEHGFTVLLLPPNWSFQYPPRTLHNDLIVDALDRVCRLPLEKQPSKSSGYDHELAEAVMEALNEVFPHSLTLIELKYQFCEEPSDRILSTVLNALRGDCYIDGARDLHNKPKLNPLERVTFTPEGRRHLAEEMKKRSKTPVPSQAAELILAGLLTEFRERNLETHDLFAGYQGLAALDLAETAAERGISQVDFDLALKDLESSGLIKSGPLDVAGGTTYTGGFLAPMIYSKREFLYLTENGYKEASEIASTGHGSMNPSIGRAGGTVVHGDQYVNYGHAAAIGPHSTGTINYQQQWTAIQNQVDLNALTSELEQLRMHLQQSASSSADYQRLALLSEAEEHVKKHDGGKAMEVLSKIGKGVLGVAKDIGTEIAAKVIAKSMGIEA